MYRKNCECLFEKIKKNETKERNWLKLNGRFIPHIQASYRIKRV